MVPSPVVLAPLMLAAGLAHALGPVPLLKPILVEVGQPATTHPLVCHGEMLDVFFVGPHENHHAGAPDPSSVRLQVLGDTPTKDFLNCADICAVVIWPLRRCPSSGPERGGMTMHPLAQNHRLKRYDFDRDTQSYRARCCCGWSSVPVSFVSSALELWDTHTNSPDGTEHAGRRSAGDR